MDNKIKCELERAILLKLGGRLAELHQSGRKPWLCDGEILEGSAGVLEWGMNYVGDAVALLDAVDIRASGTWEGWHLYGKAPHTDAIYVRFDDNPSLLRFAAEVRDLLKRVGEDLGIGDLDVLYTVLRDSGVDNEHCAGCTGCGRCQTWKADG